MLNFMSKNARHDVNCPICGVAISFKTPKQPETTQYPHRDDCRYVGEGVCPYCKLKGAIIIYTDSGKVAIRDPKIDEEYRKYHEKEAALSDVIHELECELEDEEEDPDRMDSLGKKIEKLQAQLDRVEEVFGNKIDRYDDRRERWREKAANRRFR